MLEAFVELLIIYIIYKIVFDFIIPVYFASKEMKKKMNEFNRQMQQNQQQFNTPKPSKTEKPKTDFDSDYIDYEEVK